MTDSPELVSTLRGARVSVDARRAGHVAIGICLLTLATLAAVLFAVGSNKNDQITELRDHGVPVEITVSKCLGLMGGSGSNAAGYACNGTYTVGGHRYSKAIPGDAFHAPGAKVKGIASPNDPGLVSTASDVATEHASARVFIAPSVLLALFVLIGAAVVYRSRKSGSMRPRNLRTGP